jgi:hypothetical protein
VRGQGNAQEVRQDLSKGAETVRLTLSEKLIVLGGIGAWAIAAAAAHSLTGIPACIAGAVLAAPAMVVIKRLKA